MLRKKVKQQNGLKKCLICKTNTTLRCQLCKKASFCSRVCQKAGWDSHEKTCCGIVRKK
ncbi:unnamed protein product [Heterosigma akashiwo]